MKENTHIDQLLNGYIDGVLTPRQHTELQRLMAHDAQIEQRLNELQRCKMLINSLPVAQAPSDMLQRVKETMQPKPSVPAEQVVSNNRVGAARLMFRRILASAAMIVLITALAIIVYSIVAPLKTTDTFIAVEGKREPAIEQRQSFLENSLGGDDSGSPTSITQHIPEVVDETLNRFRASLELETDKLLVADIAVKKVLERDGVRDFVTFTSGADEYMYSLDCEAGRLSSVLSGLEEIWDKFTAPILIYNSDQVMQPVIVEKISTWQIAEIASQYNPERRLKAAQFYAIMNNMQELLPRHRVVDAGKEDIFYMSDVFKPKPVLTKDEHASGQPGESEPRIQLTIILKAE